MNEDFRLAQKATAGDTEALGMLVERHRASLFRIAYRELSGYEDAQDAVADSVVRACRFIHRLNNPEHFAPWVRAIVRNEARRIRSCRRTEEVWNESTAIPNPKITERDDLRANVRQAIGELPTDQAFALHHFYLQGASVREIAQLLTRPEGTVKWMLSRGRERLAESLKEYKPMITKKARHAVLIAPNFDTAYQSQLQDALTRAGWDRIRTASDAAECIRFLTPGKPSGEPVPALIEADDFVVLSERIGNITAWELMPLLINRRKQTPFTILLLVEEGRTAEEMGVTAMSAYLSGMDFLLVRPLSLDEFESFARRALHPPA